LDDGNEHRLGELVEKLAVHFMLTEEERNQRTKTDRLRFPVRVQFATMILKKSGLLERIGRGTYRITASGQAILPSQTEITQRTLSETGVVELRNQETEIASTKQTTVETEIPNSPQEIVDEIIEILHSNLANEILEEIQQKDHAFLERLAVTLMQAMGYGKGRRTGGSGDGGIDGIISKDPLGLDKIYLQTKRYTALNKVGSKEIREFKGSIPGRTGNGVIFTTSGFTADARKEASNDSNCRLVLIDGPELAQLMIEYGVGVSEQETWNLKRLDSAYFDLDL